MSRDPFLNQSQDAGSPQMPQLQAGQRLFNQCYELLRPLGAGGMGVVWLARDHTEETDVALKFLPSVLVLQESEMRRLREEVRAGKELRHPRLVATYGLEVENGMAAIAMEYVPGQTLKEQLEAQERGFFEAEELVAWVEDICTGLAYLHDEAKRIHRDLKPANIIVDAAGHARLMDFGISHRIKEGVTRHSKTSEGQSGGSSTLAYACPQQLSGKPGDKADDIYSLGATLYELLTGTPPFFRGDAHVVGYQIATQPVTPVAERRAELVAEGVNASKGQNVPAGVEGILQACLAKEREDRPARAKQIVEVFSNDVFLPKEKVVESPFRQQEPQTERNGPHLVMRPLVVSILLTSFLTLNAFHWFRGGAALMGWLMLGAAFVCVTQSMRMLSGGGRVSGTPKIWNLGVLCLLLLNGLGLWVLFAPKDLDQAAQKGANLPSGFNRQPADVTLPSPHVGLKELLAARKEAPFINSLGMKFVPVPIGAGPSKDQLVLFSIWETRSKDYAAFMKADPYMMTGSDKEDWKTYEVSGVPVGRGDGEKAEDSNHPVQSVSHDDAVAFCAWLTKKEREAGTIGGRDEYRLPSDVEWSYAAGIGDKESADASPKEKDRQLENVFPWGVHFPPPQGGGNYADITAAERGTTPSGSIESVRDGYATTAPVGSFKANDLGVHDLGGNLWEWTNSKYDYASSLRVLRGGSWGANGRATLLSSFRGSSSPDSRGSYCDFGFRCVLTVFGD